MNLEKPITWTKENAVKPVAWIKSKVVKPKLDEGTNEALDYLGQCIKENNDRCDINDVIASLEKCIITLKELQ